MRRKRADVRLNSIRELKAEVRKQGHAGLVSLFGDHTFVGCVNDHLALVQHETKLYLVDYEAVSEELFFQIALCDFANFSKIILDPPLPIREIVLVALESEAADCEGLRPYEEIAEAIVEILVEKRELLLAYFSMEIRDGGELHSLPMLLDGYFPNVDRVPLFLLRLGSEIDWTKEYECLRGVCRELGILHTAEAPLDLPTDNDLPAGNRSGPPPGDVRNHTQNWAGADDEEQLVMPPLPSSKDHPLGSQVPCTPRSTADDDERVGSGDGAGEGDSEGLRPFWGVVEHRLFPAAKAYARAAASALASKESSSGAAGRSSSASSSSPAVERIDMPQFYPPKSLVEGGHVIQVADLPDLYKVFERC